MSELYFVAEDPTNTSSRYASRISQTTWAQYRNTIQNLHDTGLTRRQILEELAQYGFNPSFGQLVAQMTRWRMVRYSKPPSPILDSSASSVTSFSCTVTPRSRGAESAGLLRMIRILIASSTGEPPILSPPSGADGSSIEIPQSQLTTKDLTSLLMDLSMDAPSVAGLSVPGIGSSVGAGLPIDGITTNSLEANPMFLLSTADLLFLGESYAQAFSGYWDLQCSMKDSHLSIELEQIRVSAIIGCIKSAATNEQHQRAMSAAQQFVDDLEQTIETLLPYSPTPVNRLVLQDVYDSWQDKNCATAKMIFDLLTLYKKARTWISATQIRWAHSTTVHEWTCMRLVRIPAWDLAVPFLNNNPVSQVDADSVFNNENVHAIIAWAIDAVDNFGGLYDQQLAQLAPWSGISVVPRRALLFWRLGFYAKHSQPCPVLWASLSPETTFVASSEQTTCIVARMLLENLPVVERGFSHLTLSMRLHWMINQGDRDAIFSRFWQAMREALAPSFEERS